VPKCLLSWPRLKGLLISKEMEYSVKLGAAAVLALSLPFVQRSSKDRPQGSPLTVRTAKVRSGAIKSTLRVTGMLAAKNEVTLLAPRLPGRRGGGPEAFNMTLLRLAKPGSVVKKGDVVAEFDPQYMRTRLDDRQAEVEQEQRNLRRLRANLTVTMSAHQQRIRVAKAALDKAALDLESIPVRSAIQAEILRLRHEEAAAYYQQVLKEAPFVEASERAALRYDELDVESELLELRRDQNNVLRMKIAAPIGGIVVPQPVRRGAEMAEVAEGDDLRSGQPFLKIVDTRALVIDASLNQVDAERVHLGAKAKVEFDALPGVQLPGKVTALGAVAVGSRFRPDFLRQVPVQLTLEGTDPRLFPNVSASADIVLASEEAAAIVPRECVFETESGAPRAFVRIADAWEERDLVLGLANNVEVAVLDGLNEGEIVAMTAIGTEFRQ